MLFVQRVGGEEGGEQARVVQWGGGAGGRGAGTPERDGRPGVWPGTSASRLGNAGDVQLVFKYFSASPKARAREEKGVAAKGVNGCCL